MSNRPSRFPRRLLGSIALLLAIAATAYGLFLIKTRQVEAAIAAAQQQPEHVEAVLAEAVTTRSYARTTTSIGTARALRSITLQNELAGTVRRVHIETGATVANGDLLFEFDVAVEQAQLAALRAEAELAESMLGRMERALAQKGASAADVDRARAQRDMAVANVARLEAIVNQKRLRAPFAAHVGLVDVHEGQYLQPGSTLTELQGIEPAVHVDFAVTQEVATSLQPGNAVEVLTGRSTTPIPAAILAIDAKVDEQTRNVWVRAIVRDVEPLPKPGSSLRVRTPVEASRDVTTVPVNALRRSPAGNSVFVIQKDDEGRQRARMRIVESGAVLGDVVVIERGLDAGELVATEGSFKLYEGVLVGVVNGDATGN